jgi:methionine-gamma-lyase
MLMRSLETLEIRMMRSNDNARLVAEYLAGHPEIARVRYLGFREEGDLRKTAFDRQCSGPGSTFAFDVKGGEKEAFAARPSSGHEAGGQLRWRRNAHFRIRPQ